MTFTSILNAPIEITGLAVTEGTTFYRLPLDLYDKVNDGVTGLAKHTAGGTVRFATDSPKVAVKVTSLNTGVMNHMPLSGQSGVDIYWDGLFATTFRAAAPADHGFEGECGRPVVLPEGRHEIELYLPLYNGITAMEVGIEDGCTLSAPKPHKVPHPVCFYGSSITQGGCASKPGNSYNAMLARWLDFAQVNLGFSGSGRGEENVAQYIASLQLSAFVMDYDHNAPSVEHLQNTHRKFFDIIRAAQPELPIIILSKPDFDSNPAENARRRQVIFDTYDAAVRAGDKKVWFVDGESFFGHDDRRACTVDGCHPNDLGFYRMAATVRPVLEAALGL